MDFSLPQNKDTNVGHSERLVSLASGSLLALLGISRMSLPGLAIAVVGGALIHRGYSGKCNLYNSLGINTASDTDDDPDLEQSLATRGIHLEQSYLINRSPEDLYNHWRNFANLPSFMTHLKRVDVFDNNRSHWVVEAPKFAGGTVEWDAQITHDDPNKSIAWKSVDNSAIENAGEITFSPTSNNRGTEVHVRINYLPPGGKIGHYLATIFGSSPHHQLREDLRNFKRLMETGETPTTEGQPQGSCARR